MVLANSKHHACSSSQTSSFKGNTEDITITTHPGGIVEEDNVHGLFDGIPHEDASQATAPTLASQIATLTAIASMGNMEYQKHLVESTIPEIEDPSLLKLNLLIHRFHALVSNLTEENDSQTGEIIQLHSQLSSSQQHNEKLERAVSTLHVHNVKLKKKRVAAKSVTRMLIEQVKRFDAARRLSEEHDQVGKLLQHEQVLRDRTDSNFSDIDGLQDFETGSIGSIASTRSLVTSQPPTIRIHRERALTWPPTDFAQALDDEDDDDRSVVSGEEKGNKFSGECIGDESSCSITLEESVAEDEGSQSSKPASKLMGFWSLHSHGNPTTDEKAEPVVAEPSADSKHGTDAVPTATSQSNDDSYHLNSVMSMFYKTPRKTDLTEVQSGARKDETLVHELPSLKPKFELWKRSDKVSDASDATSTFVTAISFGKGRKGLLDLSDDADDQSSKVSTTKDIKKSSCVEGTTASANEGPDLSEPASAKFKSSMKNMGNMFAFR